MKSTFKPVEPLPILKEVNEEASKQNQKQPETAQKAKDKQKHKKKLKTAKTEHNPSV